jgi:hypothetical protein
MFVVELPTVGTNVTANFILDGGQTTYGLPDQFVAYASIHSTYSDSGSYVVFSQTIYGLTAGASMQASIGLKPTATCWILCCTSSCLNSNYLSLNVTYPNTNTYGLLAVTGVAALPYNSSYTAITSSQVLDSYSVSLSNLLFSYSLDQTAYYVVPSPPGRALVFTIPPSGLFKFTATVQFNNQFGGSAYAMVFQDNSTQSTWGPIQLACVSCSTTTITLTWTAGSTDYGNIHSAQLAFLGHQMYFEGTVSFSVSAL